MKLADWVSRVVVTETDQAVEKFIKEEIVKAYPDHMFIGEESFAEGEVVALTVSARGGSKRGKGC
jgi:fructose-1,6-bisphosphatase/inositol monophosphatase family enzyme